MRQLILVRHAHAEESNGGSDRDRPLSPQGLKDAEDLGNYLREQSISLDALIASSAISSSRFCSAT